MSKVSVKNLAEAIISVTDGKTGADLNNALKNSVKLLYNKKMLSQSEMVLAEIEKQIDKKENRIRMKVKSAKVIPENKKKELEETMKNKYKMKEVASEYFEDKSLLGEMKIEIGDDVLDLSYRNKLNQLAKHLISK